MRFSALRAVLILASLFPAMASANEPVIHIGAILNLSGEGSDRDAAVAYGHISAVDAVNEAGGVLIGDQSHRLDLLITDHRGSTRRAAVLGEAYLLRRDAALFLGGTQAEHAEAVAEIACDFDMPVMDPVGYGVAARSPDLLSVLPSASQRISSALNGLVVGHVRGDYIEVSIGIFVT